MTEKDAIVELVRALEVRNIISEKEKDRIFNELHKES